MGKSLNGGNEVVPQWENEEFPQWENKQFPPTGGRAGWVFLQVCALLTKAMKPYKNY